MKRTLLLAVAFATFVAVSCVTNVDLTDYAQKSASFRDSVSVDYITNLGFQNFVSFYGDYFLAHSNDADNSITSFMIFKYDAILEKYDHVLTYNVSLVEHFVPKTNGKWFGTFDKDPYHYVLFQLGSPNPADISPVNLTIEFLNPYGMTIMPDDSVVVHHQSGLSTYTFDGTNWNLNNTLDINLYENYPWTWYDLTNTHFVSWNSSGTFQLYTRNQQLGWDLIEEHETDPSYTYRLTGSPPTRTTIIDEKTIMLDSPFAFDPRDPSSKDYGGFLIIFSKQNDGTWIDQIILPSNVSNVSPVDSFALNRFVVDSNTVFISSPQEGAPPVERSVDAVLSVGSVYLLKRDANGVWQVTTSFSGAKTVDGYFGASMGMNGDAIKMLGCDYGGSTKEVFCYPYTFKACNLVQPNNVTCNDISLNNCDTIDLPSLNYTALNAYTLHDDCGPVVVEYVDNTKGDGKITVTLSFSHQASSAKSCDTTITCISSPVITPVSAPVKSPPVEAPVQKTSAAQISTVGVLALIALFF